MQENNIILQSKSGTIFASSSTMPSGTGKVEWNSSVISGNNSSSVTAIVYCHTTAGTGTWCTISGSVSIGGSSKNISKYRDSSDKWTTEWKEVGRFTTTVEHNADGTKSIPISFTISGDTGRLDGTAKGSATVTLDKINRASKLNKIDNFAIDDTIIISIDKYVTTAIDTLQIKQGDTLIREVVGIENGYSLTFTDDEKTLIDSLTTSPKITLIFLLTTTNDGSTLGTSTQSADVTLLDKPLFREIYQKENGHYQVAINGVVDTTINDVLQVYDDDGNYYPSKVLLSNAIFPVANIDYNLSEPVSKQKHGIILVFQAYVDGVAKDYDINEFFVSKKSVELLPGRGHAFFLVNSNGNKIATKYIYIHDTKIVGHSINGNGATKRDSGLTTTNYYWVLTKVIGV